MAFCLAFGPAPSQKREGVEVPQAVEVVGAPQAQRDVASGSSLQPPLFERVVVNNTLGFNVEGVILMFD